MGTYINAMETLVEQEVEQQLKGLSPRVASYINRLELVAYALNQLPALYATSERGLEHQLQRGRAKYAVPIRQAVQRAVIAIQRDPLRSVVPLQVKQAPMMQEVLTRMRLLLKNEKISWDTLPTAVERAIAATPHPAPAPSTASEPSNQTTDDRRISPAVRRYSGMPNSSPFPALEATPTSSPGRPPESGMGRPDVPVRSSTTPTRQPPVSGTPGVINASSTNLSQAVENHEAYGWDDPFYRD